MRYRIVSDRYLGYEVQVRRWWSPIWKQGHPTKLRVNTHESVEKARAWVMDPNAIPPKVIESGRI